MYRVPDHFFKFFVYDDKTVIVEWKKAYFCVVNVYMKRNYWADSLIMLMMGKFKFVFFL